MDTKNTLTLWTPEEREEHIRKNREYQKKRKESMTPEQKEEHSRKQKEYYKKWKDSMTPKRKEKYLRKQKERYDSMTPKKKKNTSGSRVNTTRNGTERERKIRINHET